MRFWTIRDRLGKPLVVQRLGQHSLCRGLGSIPGQKLRSCKPQDQAPKKKRKKERNKSKIDLNVAFNGVGWRGNRGHSHIKIMEKDLARATS